MSTWNIDGVRRVVSKLWNTMIDGSCASWLAPPHHLISEISIHLPLLLYLDCVFLLPKTRSLWVSEWESACVCVCVGPVTVSGIKIPWLVEVTHCQPYLHAGYWVAVIESNRHPSMIRSAGSVLLARLLYWGCGPSPLIPKIQNYFSI